MLSMCGNRSIAGYDKEAIWHIKGIAVGMDIRYGDVRIGGLYSTEHSISDVVSAVDMTAEESLQYAPLGTPSLQRG